MQSAPRANWTNEFIATFRGQLVPDATAGYTMYIVGGPMVRLLLDGKEVRRHLR